MSRCNENMITRRNKGRFANVVFQRNGIMRSRPDITNRVWSENQVVHLNRFQCAKEYARQALVNEEISAFYLGNLSRFKRNRSVFVGVYQLAIMDFMKPPVIRNVRLNNASFNNPGVIEISVYDDFTVTRVAVQLISADGIILEEGDAVEKVGLLECLYCVRDKSTLKPGNILRVRAWGYPGNFTENDFDLLNLL